jgi:TonB family protein
MRTAPIVLAFILANAFSTALIAQTTNEADILSFAEKMPEYPGGNDALMKAVVEKLIYPKQCIDSNIQGKVFLHFVVNEDGGIGKIEVIRGPHPLLNQAAVNALKAVETKFTPGIQAGKAVKVWYSLPVSFKVSVTTSQTGDSKNEARPEFPGGDEEMLKFIYRNFSYPEDKGIEGTALIRFVVNTDGKVQDIQVVRGLSAGLDKELVRVIALLPRFKPAKQNGVPVNVYYDLPVAFNDQVRSVQK